MKQMDLNLAAAVLATLVVGAAAASAQTAPELTLTRFDCGKTSTLNDVSRFSDVSAFKGLNVPFTFSCYLVKHGNDYLVWDTGNPPASGSTPSPSAPKTSLVEQLAVLHLKPEQITFVGISHYHGDHIGQVASFPQAPVLIGKGDWEALNQPTPNPGVNPANFAHWIGGGGKVEPLPGDKDVFGDGSGVLWNTPRHTPGHHSLMIKLKDMGNVLIYRDLAHLRERDDVNGLPPFN